MARIPGTTGNDSGASALTGTDEDDIISGLGGDDEIDGGDGDDVVLGGDGNDTITDTGDGTATLTLRESLTWSDQGLADGASLEAGFTQNTGTNSVTFNVLTDNTVDFVFDSDASNDNDHSQAGSPEAEYRSGSQLEIISDAGTDTASFEIDFATEVENVIFHVADIEDLSAFTITATGPGGAVPIEGFNSTDSGVLTSDISITGSGTNTLTFADTSGADNGATFFSGSVTVTIAGPVYNIQISYTSGDAANDPTISDIFFDTVATIAVSNDDTLFGGGGEDDIDGGIGDDTIYGDNGDGVRVAEEFLNWDAQAADGTDIIGGFTQNTGDIDVTVAFANSDTSATAEISNNTQFVGATSNYGYTFDADSSVELFGDTSDTISGEDVTDMTVSFAAAEASSGISNAVQNVSFYINDIDWQDSDHRDEIVITAIGPSGAEEILIINNGNDTVTGSGTITATIVAAETGDSEATATGSILVEIDGPITSFTIDYDNAGTGDLAVWVTDIHFETITTNDTGGGADTIAGGLGDDTIFGGIGDDDITVQGGDDAEGDSGDDLFMVDTSTSEDFNATVDGESDATGTGTPTEGDGGPRSAGDTLDLSGADGDSDNYDFDDDITGSTETFDGVKVTYTSTDGEDGTVAGLDDDSAQGETSADADLTFTEIENVIYTEDDDIADARLVTDGITINTEEGDDVILGGSGGDTINAGDGSDRVTGGSGADTIDGGNDADTITGGLGADDLDGGAGDDDIEVQGGDDADGGSGDDDFTVDTSTGEDFNATVSGGSDGTGTGVEGTPAPDDNANGNDGDTLDLSGASGDGVGGADTGVTVTYGADPENGTVTGLDAADDGADITFDEIENIIYTDDDDVADASASTSPVTIDTAGGDDVATGGSGADDIDGGAGADTLDGGAGSDTLDGGAGDDDITINEGDVASGGSGDDDFDIDAGYNTADDLNATVSGGSDGTGTGQAAAPDDFANEDDGDTLDLSNSQNGVTVTYGAGAPADGTPSHEDGTVEGLDDDAGVDINFDEIENIIYTDQDDVADASGANVAGESFTINTGGGNDTIIAGAGVTTDGGDGDDTFEVLESTGTINITGGENDVSGNLGGDNDTLDLTNAAQSLNATELAQLRTDIANIIAAQGTPDDDLGEYSGTLIVGGLTVVFTGIETFIVCFARGTRILTDRGEVAIEELEEGDLVHTMDHGLQPIRWIGSTTRRAVGKLAPIKINAGTLGNERDLFVSPQHRMLLSGWRAELLTGETEVLASAKSLINDTTITRVEGGDVEYFHMLFDQHEIVFAEGSPSESFHPGQEGWKALDQVTREEILELFPELEHGEFDKYGPTARMNVKFGDGQVLSQYLTKN